MDDMSLNQTSSFTFMARCDDMFFFSSKLDPFFRRLSDISFVINFLLLTQIQVLFSGICFSSSSSWSQEQFP